MNDLISRSVLNDVIDGLEVYTSGKPNVMKVEISVLQLQRFINILKNIPTAYDIDKVVEELEVLKRIYFLTIANTGDEKSDFAYDNVGNALDKAIEIVKQGGVSDDVCKWEMINETDECRMSCEPKLKHKVLIATCFEKCPYCHRKIKVVD